MSSSSRLVYNARVIGERFRLVRSVGEGGMGVVWEGIEERTGTRRALKFIKDEEHSPLTEIRLLREAQAASAIRHPNIVRIDEVAADDDGTPVIVMEFLEGESLGARLEREGVLSLGQAAAIVQRIAAAVSAAHAAGVVHRDLKPDNVFLVLEPTGLVDVRVLDFGIAKQFNAPTTSLTLTGELVGTPLYMSPEQAGGERDLDVRCDVWSIAVILFECLTGTTPATGDNYGQLLTRLIRNDLTRLSVLRPDLPADLLAVVDAALVPRDRRATDLAPMEKTLSGYAEREIASLRAVLNSTPSLPITGPSDTLGETVSVTWRHTTTEPTVPRGNGRAALIASAILAVVVVAGGGGFLAVRARSRKPPAVTAVTVASPPDERPREPAPDLPPATLTLTPATPPPETSTATASTVAAGAPATSALATKRAPTTPPRGAAAASASAKPGAPATRLQGGVAGEVPF